MPPLRGGAEGNDKENARTGAECAIIWKNAGRGVEPDRKKEEEEQMDMQMKRKEREVTDRADILSILDKCTVGHMAMVDPEGRPYVLPMNFCWEDRGDVVCIYLHCAKEGRKLDVLRNDPHVCFEVDCGHELVEAKNACAYSFKYESVLGYGKAVTVEDVDEKVHALTLLMKHQTGRDFVMEPKHAAIVEVIRLDLDEIYGKRRVKK